MSRDIKIICRCIESCRLKVSLDSQKTKFILFRILFLHFYLFEDKKKKGFEIFRRNFGNVTKLMPGCFLASSKFLGSWNNSIVPTESAKKRWQKIFLEILSKLIFRTCQQFYDELCVQTIKTSYKMRRFLLWPSGSLFDVQVSIR